jgi:hypothetical protein
MAAALVESLPVAVTVHVPQDSEIAIAGSLANDVPIVSASGVAKEV